MESTTAAYYLRDLGDLLRRSAYEAKRDAESAEGTPEEQYKAGRLFAYYEVISLMQQQATAFGIPLTSVSLDGVNPESDLIVSSLVRTPVITAVIDSNHSSRIRNN